MITNWLQIDGKVFNVVVTSIKESATTLYSDNTGRTLGIGAPMTLDPYGTFYNYTITVKRKGDKLDDYDKLFTYVTYPRKDGMSVKAVHNQTTWTFMAYISSAEREIKRIDENKGKVYWGEMDINIIAMSAQVTPS